MADVLIECCKSDNIVKAFNDLQLKSIPRFLLHCVKDCTEENALEVFTCLNKCMPLLFDKRTLYRLRVAVMNTASKFNCQHLVTTCARSKVSPPSKYLATIQYTKVLNIVDTLDHILMTEEKDCILYCAASQLMLELCVGYRHKNDAIQKLKMDGVGAVVSVLYNNEKKYLRRPLLFKSYEYIIKLWNADQSCNKDILRQKKRMSDSFFTGSCGVTTCRNIYFHLNKIHTVYDHAIEVLNVPLSK